MRYLLDANVLSEGVRRQPDPGVANWLVQHEAGSAISELTIGELTKGAFILPTGPRRKKLLKWIAEVESVFDDRLLPLSRDVLKAWGELCGTHEAQGHRLPMIDSLLAATALFHDLIIVTRNTTDFPPEVQTFNPWKKRLDPTSAEILTPARHRPRTPDLQIPRPLFPPDRRAWKSGQ